MSSSDPETRRRQSTEGSRRYRTAHPERVRETQAAWHARNVDKKRSYYYKAKYGLTLEQVEAMYAAGCAICGSHDNMRIDHSHQSGAVRSALCDNCNVGLGRFADDPFLLESASIYLKGHPCSV